MKTQIYVWRGEPIRNIEAWAKKRKERMVDITWEIKQVNPYAKAKNASTYYEEKESMPESFWHVCRFSDKIPIKVTFRSPFSGKEVKYEKLR